MSTSIEIGVNRLNRVAIVIGVSAVLLLPLFFWGMYAGDGQIHVVYGEQAAQGHFFEFNPGEKSAGVTSPGFMLLLAGLFKIMNPEFIPLAVKLLNLAAWYLSVLVVFRLAMWFLNDAHWSWFAAVVAGLLPGSAYNANVGMENGFFALAILFVVHQLASRGWLDPVRRIAWPQHFEMALLLGLSCWFRPEGVVLAALLFGFVAWCRYNGVRTVPLRNELLGVMVGIVVFSALLVSLVAFHYFQ
ncbi:MAG: hypothetical protein LUO89_06770, partial [Methanothrix sp.]|nr:hypothetical protein [Methanothrix sp.]